MGKQGKYRGKGRLRGGKNKRKRMIEKREEESKEKSSKEKIQRGGKANLTGGKKN